MQTLQLNTLIPHSRPYIDIGPCHLHDVRSIETQSGSIDFHGATLSNVSGISQDVDVSVVTCPITVITGDAPTALVSQTIPTDSVFFAQAAVIATEPATSRRSVTYMQAVVENVGGTVAVHVMERKEDTTLTGPVSVQLVAVGSAVRLVVAGEAGVTLKWKCKLDLLRDV